MAKFGQGMRALVTTALVALASAPISLAKDNTANQEPVAWGMQSGNEGCVIFGESQVTGSQMSQGGFTTHTVTELNVVEAIHATLPKKKYEETKDDLDALQSVSMQNHLKYVKIPKKYTPEQLDKARKLCGVPAQ